MEAASDQRENPVATDDNRENPSNVPANNKKNPAAEEARPVNPYPPGYRFMPTEEELIREYLVKKINDEPIPIADIHEVKLYQKTPQKLAEEHPALGDGEWYFFTPRDRKYPRGSRPNRSAGTGYWKATGADRSITFEGRNIGFRKALVFYQGKPPRGEKTSWIMHEFRVDPTQIPIRNRRDHEDARNTRNEGNRNKKDEIDMKLDDFVLCRIYEKPARLDRIRRRNDDPMNEVPEDVPVVEPADDTEEPSIAHHDNPAAVEIPDTVLTALPSIDGYNNNYLAAASMHDEAAMHDHETDELIDSFLDFPVPTFLGAYPHQVHMTFGDLQPTFHYGVPSQRTLGAEFLNEQQERVKHEEFQDFSSWDIGSPQQTYLNFGNSSTSTLSGDSFVKIEDSSAGTSAPDHNQLMLKRRRF